MRENTCVVVFCLGAIASARAEFNEKSAALPRLPSL